MPLLSLPITYQATTLLLSLLLPNDFQQQLALTNPFGPTDPTGPVPPSLTGPFGPFLHPLSPALFWETALAFGPALTTLFIRLPRFISILWATNPPSISLPLTMTPVPLNPPIQWTSQPPFFTLLAPSGVGSGITSHPSPPVCHRCNPFSRRLMI